MVAPSGAATILTARATEYAQILRLSTHLSELECQRVYIFGESLRRAAQYRCMSSCAKCQLCMILKLTPHAPFTLSRGDLPGLFASFFPFGDMSQDRAIPPNLPI